MKRGVAFTFTLTWFWFLWQRWLMQRCHRQVKELGEKGEKIEPEKVGLEGRPGQSTLRIAGDMAPLQAAIFLLAVGQNSNPISSCKSC